MTDNKAEDMLAGQRPVEPWDNPEPTGFTPTDLEALLHCVSFVQKNIEKLTGVLADQGRLAMAFDALVALDQMSKLQQRIKFLADNNYHMAPIPF